MKYRRLKSIAGDGTIMRYFKLDDGEEALTNVFYGIKDGAAERIEGTASGYGLIGFSHGGDKLNKGDILLDVNPAIEYMAILGEGDDRPAIGDVVNGYQKVIAIHYDGDDGVDNGEFDREVLDNPYYVFTIVQPDGSAYASEVDDSDAGEVSGGGPVTP